MIPLLAIVAVGFFLGMRHALDPDHVIAISTIASREGSMRRASLIGAAWGLGHTLTIVAVGSTIIVFRIVLPPRAGLAMELAVGLMLILLGLRNLEDLFAWPAQRVQLHRNRGAESLAAYDSHRDYVDAHGHGQEHRRGHDPHKTPLAAMGHWFKGWGLYQWARPLAIGIVHGLAGSAAIALLVLSTIPTVRWAVLYLAVFGIGTILGMMLITLTMGSTFCYAQKRSAHVGRYFGWTAGAISVAFGSFMAYRISIVEGLFRTHAQWSPR
jgi:high-affinity nickel-transport protein